MEKKNENPKIEELTDEQMKEVVGGVLGAAIGCSVAGCLNMEENCNCTKCAKGFVRQVQGGRGRCVLP